MRRLLRLLGRDWDLRAACANEYPDMWFPEPGGRRKETVEAKKICKECPVQQECLEWSLVNDESYGIWGGLDPRERYLLAQRMGIS